MLEILVVMAAIYAICMAKAKRRRRRMSKYIPGSVDQNINLGTLAAGTAILSATQVVKERTRVSSIDATYILSGMTKTDNVGPLEVGVAHSDYSLAEIDAFLERLTSWDEGDKVSQELSNRLIRRIGVFDVPADPGEAVALNEGKKIKTKLNWILNAGQGLNFFVYNMGSGALATTDPNVHINGKANLWPQ